MGSRKPSMAAAGSLVRRPARSVAQVSGIGLPRFNAARIFARATTLIAMSRMKGAPGAPGTPKPMGLLPRRASLPPVGAMVTLALLATTLAKPASAASQQYGPTAPKWLLL